MNNSDHVVMMYHYSGYMHIFLDNPTQFSSTAVPNIEWNFIVKVIITLN